ncbi:PDDEXK nuclease domain-containing protein [Leptolyngbya sp. PCC 6406]|uniref:PDDEXK nuclease domain-containing protein n=1 Tax=Leptolyngbya sp. PCC 6406 TaxID=1173264 RepID=UPI0002AC7BAD
MTDSLSFPNRDYEQLFLDLKERIRLTQVRAAIAVNRELIVLYWQIGRQILQRQVHQGWGSKVIDRLAQDLQREFPDMKGFSSRNLRYMRAFAEAYPEEKSVDQVMANLPWGHNVRLLDALDDPEERLWYAQQAIAQGWSRNILLMQIEKGLYTPQNSAINNFERTLPQPQSDLAQNLLKDPYHFDFLCLGADVQERDLEKALVDRIRDFLLELGVGFAFVGSQYRLEVGGEDFYLDLLFYHLQLRCYVVIDLKMGDFQPEYSGKMNFYVSAVDDLLRHSQDQPTIGIILCKSKNKTIAEYALRDVIKPIGISTHRLGSDLPDALKQSLPSPEVLEQQMAKITGDQPGDEF